MKKRLTILSVVMVVMGVFSSCNSSDDCECAIVDKIITGTVTSTVQDEQTGEERVDTTYNYTNGETRDFLFSDWDEDCSKITMQDIPEKWSYLFADTCSITCSDK